MKDKASIVGCGIVRLYGPDGKLKREVDFDNRVTDRGDQFYARHGAGDATETAVSGMRLGVGTATETKNGAGSFIAGADYVAGSSVALSSAPSVTDKGAGLGHRVTYVAFWAAGTATATINEVVITNQSSLTNVAGDATDTIARAVISTVNKAVDDTLEITWHHDLLGA